MGLEAWSGGAEWSSKVIVSSSAQQAESKRMSVITVQLGQCGNQIGGQLFSTLYEDACSNIHSQRLGSGSVSTTGASSCFHEASIERFFVSRETRKGPDQVQLQARAVLVDMESKVVHQSLQMGKKSRQWEYDSSCVYTQKRGSGNNWANGYCKQGPPAVEHVLDMVQKQAERCDRLDGFLVLMSVAGGTGSGVGALITENLRDFFPHNTIVNQVVWPYVSGEVIVQNYNTTLTTAHLQHSSDAILVLQNDQLHKACSKLLLLKQISFSDINKVICHALASVLQPSVSYDHFNQIRSVDDPLFYQQCTISNLQTHLCPHPDFKLLSIKNIPQMPERSHAYSRFLWSGLLKHLRQMLITNAPIEEGMDWSLQLESGRQQPLFSYREESTQRVSFVPQGVNKSLANLLILRGNELDTADIAPFQEPKLYTGWVPTAHRCKVWCSKQTFNKYEKCCTLVSNSQSCVHPLDRVCQRAWDMFSARAYVHQYVHYGLSEDEFLDSFVSVEQILKNYTSLI